MSEDYDYDSSWEAAALAGEGGGLVYRPAAAAAQRSLAAPRVAAQLLWRPSVVWLVVAIYFLLLLLPSPTARGFLTLLPS